MSETVEQSIKYARSQIINLQSVTPIQLVDYLGDNAEACIEQIRLSYGSSLIAFFRLKPNPGQLVALLDQTLQDLKLLRKSQFKKSQGVLNAAGYQKQ